MFHSHGSKGNLTDSGTVEPFEVLGKWMGRYAMWQMELADQLFIAKGCKLGPSEIIYDPEQQLWEYVSDNDEESDDDLYSIDYESSASASEINDALEAFLPEERLQCVYIVENEDNARYTFRKRKSTDDRVTCVEIH